MEDKGVEVSAVDLMCSAEHCVVIPKTSHSHAELLAWWNKTSLRLMRCVSSATYYIPGLMNKITRFSSSRISNKKAFLAIHLIIVSFSEYRTIQQMYC